MKKFKIFLSCGQREREKKTGLDVSNYFNKKYNDTLEILFSEEIFDSKGLTEIIYKNLNLCDGFIAVFHKREKINKTTFKSSLFANQELAIASFLEKKNFRIYAEDGVELEGIRKYIMNRDIPFSSTKDIINDLEPVIKEWLGIWKPKQELIQVNKPDLIQISNQEKGMIGMDFQINIDNISENDIDNFIFGMLSSYPITIFSENNKSKEYLLSGILNSYFLSDDKYVNHYVYKGKIENNLQHNIKSELRWKISYNIDSFAIGIYMRGDNLDLSTYGLIVKNAKQKEFSFEFFENVIGFNIVSVFFGGSPKRSLPILR
jgi:hypothetical protein